jgi:hypothetical protein
MRVSLALVFFHTFHASNLLITVPIVLSSLEHTITSGELTKEVVVRNCLSHMKECFNTCNREVTKLDDAIAKYFPPIGLSHNFVIIERNLSMCGVCHNDMDIRVSCPDNPSNIPENNCNPNYRSKDNQSRYLYCNTCLKSYMLPSRGNLSRHPMNCVICGFQVLTVRNPDTQKDHTICPHCFK